MLNTCVNVVRAHRKNCLESLIFRRILEYRLPRDNRNPFSFSFHFSVSPNTPWKFSVSFLAFQITEKNFDLIMVDLNIRVDTEKVKVAQKLSWTNEPICMTLTTCKGNCNCSTKRAEYERNWHYGMTRFRDRSDNLEEERVFNQFVNV